MRAVTCLIPLLLAILIASCGDDGSTMDPNDQPDMVVRLIVRDTSGVGLPDLRVSGWNLLEYTRATLPTSKSFQWGFLLPYSFYFAVPYASRVTIVAKDMEGQLLDTLTDQDYAAGDHTVSWDSRLVLTGCQVVRFSFVAVAQLSRDTLFNISDDRFLCYHAAVLDTIGFTSSKGVFETTDRRFFPSTYDLGPFVWRDESNIEIGTYEILDTFHFVLTDTATGEFMGFDSTVGLGVNEFDITWNPSK